MWSTIKTLPATLPELRTMDRRPRTGLLEPFLPQIWMSVRGWGRRARAVVRGPRTLVDGLIKAGVDDIFGVGLSAFHKTINALGGMRNDIK